MRALIISHNVPYFPGPGGNTREYCLARELSKRHQIAYVVPVYQGSGADQIARLEAFCRVLPVEIQIKDTFWSRVDYSIQRRIPFKKVMCDFVGPPLAVQSLSTYLASLRRFLRTIDWLDFDLVQIEYPHVGEILKGFSIPVSVLLDWVDVHTALLNRERLLTVGYASRLEKQSEFRRTKRYERWLLRRVDKSLATSTVDAQALYELDRQADVTIVPNGVDCDYFHNPGPCDSQPNTLVFTGTMDYPPNVEGVLFFCEQVLPLLLSEFPDLHFYIVGIKPVPDVCQLAERYPGTVTVTGFVEDVRPYLQRATLCVVPLLNGGGTRLKILEAMAMQRAVVSTSVGCEGLSVTRGEDILIADTPRDFAQSILSLLNHPQRRQQIAEKGHQLVRSMYDWRQIALLEEGAWKEAVERYAQRAM